MDLISDLKRQNAVLVLQQHHRLARRPQGKLPVLWRVIFRKRNLVEGNSAGGSNIPRRNLAMNRRFRAVSISLL